MSVFPNIRLPSSIEETIKNPTIESEFESGIKQTRARYTRLRHIWILTWQALEIEEYNLLKRFYVAQYGGAASFLWEHPHEYKQYLVRFTGDFKAKNSVLFYWDLSITLEEV